MSSGTGSFFDELAASLENKDVISCSEWTRQHRRIGGAPWSFSRYPYLREIHDCPARRIVIKKGAQMGITEAMLNVTFHTLDVKGKDVLYVLPTKDPDASDFTRARFDPALESSPHLSEMFTNVSNVGHKRAGSLNLFVRGSNSRSGLKTIPVALVILDEYDEMMAENLHLAEERLSGHVGGVMIRLSTPTIEEYGIAKEWGRSDQRQYWFPCPYCHKPIKLEWPEAFYVEEPELPKTAEIICPLCKTPMPRAKKIKAMCRGEWRATEASDVAGFHINQLYSPTLEAFEIAEKWRDAQHDQLAEQEFYNSKLGMEHSPAGSRVQPDQIERCISNYAMQYTSAGACMGVDVGKLIHFEIAEWKGKVKRVLQVGKVIEFRELVPIMRAHNVYCCVVDARPETREARRFQMTMNQTSKIVWLAFYLPIKQLIKKNDEQATID